MPTTLRRWLRASLAGLLALAGLGAMRRQTPPQLLLRSTRPAGEDPHPGCLAACHQPHNATTQRFPPQPLSLDAVCLRCHAGTPKPAVDRGALKLPLSPASTVSRHGQQTKIRGPLPFRRVIQQGGKPFVLTDDCSACHDVHSKQPGMPSRWAFDERGQILGFKPVSTAQTCFGCHAGPEAAVVGPNDPDLGALFARSAMSSHVIGKGAADRPDLPSLRGGSFEGKLDCTSCHDNPDPAGPRGPHASTYPALLKAPYGKEQDVGSVGDQANALCYRCHDRRSIESDRSFPLHREHLTGFTGPRPLSLGSPRPLPLGMRIGWTPGGAGSPMTGFGEPTPCATCHDPHGSRDNPSLIRFDPAVVTRSSVGGVTFYRSGLGHGTCTLTCHGYDHVQTKY